MMKMKRLLIIVFTLVVGIEGVLTNAWAMTHYQLKELLASGEKITVIDIRSPTLYTQGHILGAINIPASIIGRKRLPAIGRVVVCGDGVQPLTTLEAVAKLNEKRGIQAEELMGGYSSWEANRLATTREKGVHPKKLQYMNYKDFKRAALDNADLVLVDVRHSSAKAGKKKALTDLSTDFLGATIIKVGKETDRDGKNKGVSRKILSQGKEAHLSKLYVIIDNADGSSEEVADQLLSAGVKRVAILVGGEEILKVSGKSAKKRALTTMK